MELPWSGRCGLAPTPSPTRGRNSGCSTRGEDFYLATSGDILLAIREDFLMAMDMTRVEGRLRFDETDHL
jgi:hypothetical protein